MFKPECIFRLFYSRQRKNFLDRMFNNGKIKITCKILSDAVDFVLRKDGVLKPAVNTLPGFSTFIENRN
jgi:hypothetical protein